MKKILLFYSIVFFCISSLNAQTTSGKEFWLTFGRNVSAQPVTSPYYSLQIRIVNGNLPTTVIIDFTHINEQEEFNLSPYEIYTHPLSPTQKEATYNTIMGITDYSIHITSSEPVAVYAFNGYTGNGSCDATNLLPVTALGRNYYQMSYSESSSFFTDAYAVVATKNNTHLYHNGDSVTTINAGQVYYRTSSDMTGAQINSSSPVAFFALHQGTQIPSGVSHISILFQQLAPVNTWGKSFFVPVTVTESEIVRIVVSQDHTNITEITGGAIRYGVPGAKTSLTDLMAGDFAELDIGYNGCFIQAEKPVGVCSYLKYMTSPYPNEKTSSSQAWIPAIEQTVFYALASPFLLGDTWLLETKHYALIITPTATRGNTKVSIGGAPSTNLAGGNWIMNSAANMSFYSMPLTNDTETYIFSNPHGIITFGYQVCWNGQWRSYYYPTYSAMRELDAAFYTNDIHFQDLIDTTFCAQVVHFRAEIENMGVEVDSIKWYIDGAEYLPAQDSLEWNKSFPVGEYSIKMWVRFENNDTLSKTGTLKIKECDFETAFYANNVHSDTLQNVTFCEKTVNFQAEIEGQWVSIKWYINGVEETAASNQETWSKEFGPGEHIGIPVIMEVIFANNEPVTIESALNVRVFWTQIKNIRH
jgi:hypothetical protein